MAKKQFPIVPVLIGAGLLGGVIYLITKKETAKEALPVSPPIKTGPPIVAPTPQQSASFQARLKSPYLVQPLPLTPPMPVPISSEQISKETCLFGGEFVPEGDPRYNSIPTNFWVIDRYGRRGKCLV